MSQPTLSAAINSLEQQLGKRLVVRDRRFIELTPEGEAILPWARQLVAAQEGMNSVVGATKGALKGEVRLGAIPAALPWTGRVGEALLTRQPGLSLAIRSLTSREIVGALTEFALDAGITYLDHEPPAHVLSVPLYTEHYRVMARKGGLLDGRGEISLADAADLPLCLLHQGMQNRRILDARMAEHGLALSPRVTADSYVALFSLVQTGQYATIIPDSYALLLPDIEWTEMLGFSESVAGSRIGLVVLDRAPAGPFTGAILKAAQAVALIENPYQ